MGQLIPSLDRPLAPLAVAFRREVFDLFRRRVAAWIVCLGRHTICRVWEITAEKSSLPAVEPSFVDNSSEPMPGSLSACRSRREGACELRSQDGFLPSEILAERKEAAL